MGGAKNYEEFARGLGNGLNIFENLDRTYQERIMNLARLVESKYGTIIVS
jgi:hypothetical protein